MQSLETTIQALENLNTDAFQYHAIALDDGKLANNGGEAAGIIKNKPKSGEAATIGYIGEMRFAAGLAVSADDGLTVTTSGWFKAAGSGSYIVGRAKAAVTSGSIGFGIFDFTKPVYASESSFAW